MMKPLFLLALSIFIYRLDGFAAPSLKLDPELGKITGNCKAKENARHVWFFKQWHLSPSINTKERNNFQKMPQEKNQTAIYRQLDRWVGKGQLKEIYAEGCTGELDFKSKVSFNGWTIRDLKKASKKPFYPQILTSIPLKIEAKYDKAVLTLCGDDEELVKENNLAFSDARGTMGFLTRITQYKDDPKRRKVYVDGAIELYKMPPSTSVDQVIAKLKTELGSAVQRAKDTIEKRNQKLVQTIQTSAQKEVAVIYGGMHTTGIAKLLDQAGIGCSIVEPVGYQDDETQLMQRLEESLKTL